MSIKEAQEQLREAYLANANKKINNLEKELIKAKRITREIREANRESSRNLHRRVKELKDMLEYKKNKHSHISFVKAVKRMRRLSHMVDTFVVVASTDKEAEMLCERLANSSTSESDFKWNSDDTKILIIPVGDK